MDQELKQHLDGMETRLRMNSAEAVEGVETRLLAHSEAMEARVLTQIEAVETRLLTQIEAVETRLLAHGEAMETRLRAHTEGVETQLLGEFRKWARTADARYRQSHSVVGALDERVQAVEDRVAELERKKAS